VDAFQQLCSPPIALHHSGHGTCKSVRQLASLPGARPLSTASLAYGAHNAAVVAGTPAWAADTFFACV
jgi:hypothetical protein